MRQSSQPLHDVRLLLFGEGGVVTQMVDSEPVPEQAPAARRPRVVPGATAAGGTFRVGPYTSSQGEVLFSAFAPVRDRTTGEVLAVVSVDVAAE